MRARAREEPRGEQEGAPFEKRGRDVGHQRVLADKDQATCLNIEAPNVSTQRLDAGCEHQVCQRGVPAVAACG